MDIYNRIKLKRIELGLTQKELAYKVGFKNHSAIAKIEAGMRDIGQTQIVKFAEALNTTPAYLMGWEDNQNELDLFSIPNITPLPPMKKVPLVGSIACSTPITATENIEGYIDVPIDSKVDFCLTAKGDSMINARIFNGDIVYIHQQPDVENGEIAVVLIDDEATLKRVYKSEGKITLRAENPTYADIVYSIDDKKNIKILGKAVQFLSKVL